VSFNLLVLIVPDRRRFGHVNVTCVMHVVLAFVAGRGGKREGWRGPGKGPQNGQLTLSMGPAYSKWEFVTSYKELLFQVRGLDGCLSNACAYHMQYLIIGVCSYRKYILSCVG
jgi:hypothetical protein